MNIIEDPKVLISIYAAIISTITLIWNIALSIINKISRIEVQVSFGNTYRQGKSSNIVDGPKVIMISIVNKSNKIKYVKSLKILLPYETKYGNKFNLIKQNIKFPIQINPEQEYTFNHLLNETTESMFENFKKGKCSILVYDTTNKKYKSNKFTSMILKDIFTYNKGIKPEIWELFK